VSGSGVGPMARIRESVDEAVQGRAALRDAALQVLAAFRADLDAGALPSPKYAALLALEAAVATLPAAGSRIAGNGTPPPGPCSPRPAAAFAPASDLKHGDCRSAWASGDPRYLP
jgi:hypothetical protein